MAAPKQIEVFPVKARRPRFKGGEWGFRARSRNGQVTSPHSEAPHSRDWTRRCAQRAAAEYGVHVPVVTVQA